MAKVEPCCCPKFDPKPFDDKEISLDGKLFVEDTVYSLFYIPVTFSWMMNRVGGKIARANAEPEPKDVMTLHQVHPCSPWSSRVFVTATKEVEDASMAKIPGKFLCKVFQGPYSDVGKWVREVLATVKDSKGQEPSKIFAFYPYCPRCIKHYGENYVVMMALIE